MKKFTDKLVILAYGWLTVWLCWVLFFSKSVSIGSPGAMLALGLVVGFGHGRQVGTEPKAEEEKTT